MPGEFHPKGLQGIVLYEQVEDGVFKPHSLLRGTPKGDLSIVQRYEDAQPHNRRRTGITNTFDATKRCEWDPDTNDVRLLYMRATTDAASPNRHDNYVKVAYDAPSHGMAESWLQDVDAIDTDVEYDTIPADGEWHGPFPFSSGLSNLYPLASTSDNYTLEVRAG